MNKPKIFYIIFEKISILIMQLNNLLNIKSKTYITLFILLLSTTLLFSQKYEKIRTKADNKFWQGEYHLAYQLYKKAYKKTKDKKDKSDINFLIGDCFKFIREIKQSEAYYKKAMKMNDKDPLIILNHANMLRMFGNYEEAIKEYELFLKFIPNEKRGVDAINACNLAQEWIKNPSRYIVDEMSSLNTKFNDFSPIYDTRKDYKTIMFSSTRENVTGKRISKITGERFSDIFISNLDRKGKWSEAEPLDTLINSEFDEGVITLNEKSNEMFYTKCKIENKNKVGCQIYKTAKQEGYWAASELVQIIGDSISIGHPSLSKDEKTLYFSSRELGGSGGADLFKVTRPNKTGSWGKPENLGIEINSQSDELYPFIREDNILFFSSDREPTMGGLDIHKAYKNKDSIWVIENMKYPINSNADDFGIIFQGTEEKGLFSSARKGGRGGVDIYSFIIPPLEFSIAGIAKDKDTDELIEDVVVKLVGSDGRIFRDTTKAEKGFNFKLKPKTDYIYIASKEGYFNYKGTISTDSLDRSQIIKADVFLSSVAKTIELPNIEYDFAKWDLRETSKTALNTLVTTLNDNPTITIELLSHSDMIGNDSTNLVISQKRAQSVVDYLISKNIEQERLIAKGYGKTKPRVSDKLINSKYSFIPIGVTLNEIFIENLTDEKQKEICNQLNRRTEFKVLSTNYMSNKKANTP